MRTPIILPLLTLLLPAATALADTAPQPATGFYRAPALDAEGRLDDALPLYAERAAATLTQADRLQWASALLRAGRTDEARQVLDQVASEAGSIEHRPDAAAVSAGVGASAALRAGFPAVAVDYARQAFASQRDPGMGLLLVRALAAAGDDAAARAVLRDMPVPPGDLGDGRRLELARANLLVGDATAARALLETTPEGSVAQMFRDALHAEIALRRGNWEKAARLLEAAERKVPKDLAGGKVARAWRNVQRELQALKLRRAVALWRQGQTDVAVRLAKQATASDEEYVRSAAIIVLVTADLQTGRREPAADRLRALAGHHRTFAPAVEALTAVVRSGGDAQSGLAKLRSGLDSTDRSASIVSAELVENLGEAVGPTRSATR